MKKQTFNFWRVSTSHPQNRTTESFMLEDGKDPLTSAFTRSPRLRGTPSEYELRDEDGAIVGTFKTQFIVRKNGEPITI